MRRILLTATLITTTAWLAACDPNTTKAAAPAAAPSSAPAAPVDAPAKPSSTPAPATHSAAVRSSRTSDPGDGASRTSDPGDGPGDAGDGNAKPCTAAALSVSIGEPGGAGGHISAPLHFKNAGSGNCWLDGYATVVPVTAAGRQLTPARHTLRGFAGGLPQNDNDPSGYLLEPGNSVDATVEALNRTSSGAGCGEVTALLVTPPGAGRATRVTWSDGCAGFEVHPPYRG